MIGYKGKQYNTREIHVDKNKGYVKIAELALNEAMPAILDKEAKEIDKEIAYYADPREWELSDEELRNTIYGPPKSKKKNE